MRRDLGSRFGSHIGAVFAARPGRHFPPVRGLLHVRANFPRVRAHSPLIAAHFPLIALTTHALRCHFVVLTVFCDRAINRKSAQRVGSEPERMGSRRNHAMPFSIEVDLGLSALSRKVKAVISGNEAVLIIGLAALVIDSADLSSVRVVTNPAILRKRTAEPMICRPSR